LQNECCLKLQTWLWVVLIIVGVVFALSLVGGVIRCTCCD
jgi:hypothetical protein